MSSPQNNASHASPMLYHNAHKRFARQTARRAARRFRFLTIPLLLISPWAHPADASTITVNSFLASPVTIGVGGTSTWTLDMTLIPSHPGEQFAGADLVFNSGDGQTETVLNSSLTGLGWTESATFTYLSAGVFDGSVSGSVTSSWQEWVWHWTWNDAYVGACNIAPSAGYCVPIGDSDVLFNVYTKNNYLQLDTVEETHWLGILGSPIPSASLAVRDTAPSPVPEPASLFLLGTGLLGLVGAARRRMKK